MNPPLTRLEIMVILIRKSLGLVRERGYAAVSVRLGWLPDEAAPAFREVTACDPLGFSQPIPASCLPPSGWFDIAAINRDLQLDCIPRAEKMKNGYFFPE